MTFETQQNIELLNAIWRIHMLTMKSLKIMLFIYRAYEVFHQTKTLVTSTFTSTKNKKALLISMRHPSMKYLSLQICVVSPPVTSDDLELYQTNRNIVYKY